QGAVNGQVLKYNGTAWVPGTDNTVSGVSGSGTTNYLPKWTSGSALGNSVIYENTNGNVGIGTTSPSKKFHVNGELLASGGLYFNAISKIYYDANSNVRIYGNFLHEQ